MRATIKTAFFGIFIGTLFGCTSFQSKNLGESLTCDQHEEVAQQLNEWATRNFEQDYGKNGDVDGALAQFFLIDQRAPSPYASAFNRHQEIAVENLSLAKKKSCDTSQYPLAPIDYFRVKVDAMIKTKGK
ncbi:hypothetical protein [Pandoraea aquatica]|uniref:hypothetical protein n=1 Tax=Pandoraea aquatica TaxID=2508290 RepID=UPI00123F12B6|nr:hypothetical protein [Pandoraea aquatica]